MLKNVRKIILILVIWYVYKLKLFCEEGKGIGIYNCKLESLESRNLIVVFIFFLKDVWCFVGIRLVNFFKYFFI